MRRDWSERFWKYVTFEPNSGCWPWVGAATSGGYGVLGVGSRMRRATHLSVALDGRSVNDGQIVMHSCDQPSCVNPDHLTVATLRDNTADMIKKGRHNDFAKKLVESN